jgi:ribose transport system substrate-binding protein
MNEKRIAARRGAIVALVLAALVAIAGCGSSSSSSSSASASPTTSAASSASSTSTSPSSSVSAGVAGIPPMSQLTGQGYETPPPASGPAPAKGKSVWWVSCGMSIPACSVPANAAAAAAKKIGFDFHIADGKLNVGGGDLVAFRTALAAHPAAIIIHGISCPIVETGLRQAKSQGVLTMGVEALDCSDTNQGSKLFTNDFLYSAKAPSGVNYFTAWGKISADYIIQASGGKAQVVAAIGTEPLQAIGGQGFTTEMKKCSGCSLVDTINFTSADLIPGGPWVQKMRPALISHPAANYVWLQFDPNVALGTTIVNQELAKANAVGGSGEADEQDFVRQGKLKAITGAHDAQWMGWGAMDEINRALQKKPSVPEGVGPIVETKDANLPPQGSGFISPIKYQDVYLKSWGVH